MLHVKINSTTNLCSVCENKNKFLQNLNHKKIIMELHIIKDKIVFNYIGALHTSISLNIFCFVLFAQT